MASSDHFDPLHQLTKTQYGDEAGHHCDICLSKLAGEVGHSCRACNMDLHDACCSHFKETISFFAHPWHTLKLSRIPSGGTTGKCLCDLCMEECPPGSFVYRCAQCLFDVHPLCTMFPQTIRIPQHPEEHDFRMVPSSGGNCSVCEQPVPMWHYVCPCAARLHIDCAYGIASAAGKEDDEAADDVVAQTTSSSRPKRRTVIAKFLLKTSIRFALDAATGGTASPVLDVLAAAFS